MDGVAHDAIIIGHGDWIVDPVTQDAQVDRNLQLTPVNIKDFISIFVLTFHASWQR